MLHHGHKLDTDNRARAPPIFQTTSFEFKSAEHGGALFELSQLGPVFSRSSSADMVVVWSLLGVQPILLVRACVALASRSRGAVVSVLLSASQGGFARGRPLRRRRGLKRAQRGLGGAASRFARARRAGRERERESHIVASHSHGPLAPLHTRYYHLPDTIPMHPFSAEHGK